MIPRRVAICKPNTVALPVAPCPFEFGRKTEIWNISEKRAVHRSHLPAATYEFRETFQLFPPDSRLNIGHPVVKTDLRIALKDNAIGRVPDRIRNGHSVLPPQTKPGIPLLMFCGNHPAIARGKDFSRMEGEASRISMRSADALPSTVPPDFATDCTRGILNQRD
jgi:hypothetical protein